MGERRTFTLAAALLAVVAGALIAGCGGSSAGPATAKSIATQALGHAPSGLAQTIVDRGSVIVVDDASYAPQSSFDRTTGKLVGFDVDVAKRVGQLLGLTVTFKNAQWETVIPGLSAGKWDVSIGSMAITRDRQKTVAFTAPYYYTPGQLFVTKGGAQIASVADLSGETVGVAADTVFYDFLQTTDAAVKVYPSDSAALAALRKGKVAFVMTAASVGEQAILRGQPFDLSGSPLFYQSLAFATEKGQADWLALLNYAIRKMQSDGSLSALSKKWFNGLDLTVKK